MSNYLGYQDSGEKSGDIQIYSDEKQPLFHNISVLPQNVSKNLAQKRITFRLFLREQKIIATFAHPKCMGMGHKQLSINRQYHSREAKVSSTKTQEKWSH